MEDTQILSAFWNREEEAITQTKHTYGGYCAAIAGKFLDAPEDVEEVLNDTWLHAWNAIPPDQPGNLKLYLGRITRNLALDKFRSQTRKKRGGTAADLPLEELAECISGSGNPEQHLECRELGEAVNRFLGTLPKRDRGIFLLRYYYLETPEQIAGRYGIRQTLVRTVLSRTRKKLKDYLQKEGYPV